MYAFITNFLKSFFGRQIKGYKFQNETGCLKTMCIYCNVRYIEIYMELGIVQ